MYGGGKKEKQKTKPKTPKQTKPDQNQNDRLLTQSLELKIIPKAHF